MSDIEKKIDQVLKLGLSQFLKSEGFKKTGRHWRKQTNDGWLLVSVQASSYNRGTDEGEFAVNLGIFNTEVENMAARFHYDGTRLPKAEGSTLQCRLNDRGYGHDYWWKIGVDSDLQVVADDVVDKMRIVGLPWLLENNNMKSISTLLRDSYSTAAFSSVLITGDEQEVVRRIKAAIKERPNGKEHFMGWAKNVGIDIQ